MLKKGHTQSEIASAIGVEGIFDVDKSILSREIRRNSGGRGYQYQQTHRLALFRHQCKPKLQIDRDIWAFIEQLIWKDWSPEQISGWMKKELCFTVSHEWITKTFFIQIDWWIPVSSFTLQKENKETLPIQGIQAGLNEPDI